MPLTSLEEEATRVEAQILLGFRVGVIGSASFWHEESEQICSDIGERLAGLNSLVLLTGGVPGVGEYIGRGFVTGCCKLGQTARVIHVLPRGCGAWDYGMPLLAGDSMTERREILGRLAKVCVVVEGGPGTEHEANVAVAHEGAACSRQAPGACVEVGRHGNVSEGCCEMSAAFC